MTKTTYDNRGKGHMTTEVEVRMTYPQDEQTQDCQSPPEARREAWGHFSLRASRRKRPCQHRDFRLLPSTAVESNFLRVQPPKFVVVCFSSPRKRRQPANGETVPEVGASTGDLRARDPASRHWDNTWIRRRLKQEVSVK